LETALLEGRDWLPAVTAAVVTATRIHETEVLQAIARKGRSNPDVAAEMFLSRNTVQTHVAHILTKLKARSRADIVREALRASWQPMSTNPGHEPQRPAR
jgi:DNA-binding NarL/FixJ family response regulator